MRGCMHNSLVSGNDNSELVFQCKNALVNVTQREPVRQFVRQTCNKSGYPAHRCGVDVVLITTMCILLNWKVLLRNSNRLVQSHVPSIGNLGDALNCVAHPSDMQTTAFRTTREEYWSKLIKAAGGEFRNGQES